MKLSLLLLLGGLSPAALAQPADAPDAGAAGEPVTQDSAATTAPPNALQPEPEKLGFLQGKLEALEAKYAETNGDVSALKKLKVSGYLQGRYTYLDADTPESRFTVRRARLKTMYQGDVATFALEFDANSAGVSLKVAEGSVTEPWSGKRLVTLVAGQMKVPFGYETPQSSSERELPEQARAIAAFNNGEYDRGVKLAFRYDVVRAQLGVFDGNGTNNAGFLGKDNDTEKDLIGRVGVDLKWFSAGVSGWAGKTLKAGDRFYARNRLGLDAQVYLDVLPIGGTALKAEVVAGTTWQASGAEKYGQTGLGWYLLLVQNLSRRNQVALRYDFFDPWTGVPNGADPADPGRTAPSNQVHTLGLQASHFFDEVVKLSVTYELPLVATSGGGSDVAPRQNLLTVQLQAKF